MRHFTCPTCGKIVEFSNTTCLSCGSALHFDIASQAFVGGAADCANRDAIHCNWAAMPGKDGLCWSCAMTEVIPETFHGENLSLWADTETAKRRVLATLGRWGWCVPGDPGAAPVFHMLSEDTSAGERDVVMAHGNGTITINVIEADDAERVGRREELGEKLRTMIAHFRHEIAHYLFLRLSDDPAFVEAFRALMGDERQDYGAALKRYYADGAPPNWQASHITEYASSHPHEDWAETVTHLLHLTDIIDCAVAVQWRSPLLNDPQYDAYRETDPDRIIALGSSVALSVNHINRSIGISDIYPFVLTDGVREKLGFVHGWLSRGPVA